VDGAERRAGYDIEREQDRHGREPSPPDPYREIALHEVEQHVTAVDVGPPQPQEEAAHGRAAVSQPHDHPHAGGNAGRGVVVLEDQGVDRAQNVVRQFER
jgi:hypothetical protein